MKRVKSFGVYQTAKVVAIIYFLIAVAIAIPASLFMFVFKRNFGFGEGIIFVFLPFIYALMGFLFTALGCVIYNLVASKTGGIEFEISTEEPIFSEDIQPLTPDNN